MVEAQPFLLLRRALSCRFAKGHRLPALSSTKTVSLTSDGESRGIRARTSAAGGAQVALSTAASAAANACAWPIPSASGMLAA